MTDATFERDMIAYLQERGYRVTRARGTSSRAQLKGKRLLVEHQVHRASVTPALDVCRLCRFVRAVREHGRHGSNVDGCFMCLDERTAYVYPSTFRPERFQIVA